MNTMPNTTSPINNNFEMASSESDLPSEQTVISEEKKLRQPLSPNQLLWNKYLLILVLANIVCLFFKGYPQDLGYWTDWVKQLQQQGYQHFNGNYPPIYIHWLWIVSKFYWITGTPIEANLLLKFLTQIPVLIAHAGLARIIFNYLTQTDKININTHFLLILTVLNPAILINGPLWGQVDLIPVYFACIAIIYSCSPTKIYWMIPAFVLSLLTKFQMIALAPLFGFLFFREIKKQLLGILIALCLIAIAFSPYLLTGHFVAAFKQAYIDTLGQYPMTTFNAANIWIILTGNTSPDSRILFGEHSGILNFIFTAKYFGMILFASLSAIIFMSGLMQQIKLNNKLKDKNFAGAAETYYLKKHLEYAFFTAMLCALVFFLLLPAMHERYMFPAVVLSLIFCVITQTRIFIAIGVSLICAFNMLIIVDLSGSEIWHGLAWVLTGLVSLLILDFLFNFRASILFEQCVKRVLNTKHFGVFFFAILIPSLTTVFVMHFKIHPLNLTKNQVFLDSLPRTYAHQDHGNLNVNRSFDGNLLSMGGKRYEKGFGTHANSDIQFVLPKNAKTFSFIPGLDDEVGSAEVSFSVWGDNKLLWTSPSHYGSESVKLISLNIENVQLLNLKVDAKADDRWDHADWINPVIELAK